MTDFFLIIWPKALGCMIFMASQNNMFNHSVNDQYDRLYFPVQPRADMVQTYMLYCDRSWEQKDEQRSQVVPALIGLIV